MKRIGPVVPGVLNDAEQVELSHLSAIARERLGDPLDSVFWTSPDGECIIFEEPPQIRSVYIHDKMIRGNEHRYNVRVAFPWSYYIVMKYLNAAEIYIVWSQVPLPDLDTMTYHSLLTNVKETTHFCAPSEHCPDWTYKAAHIAVNHTMASSFNGGSYHKAFGLLPEWVASKWVKKPSYGDPWEGWVDPDYFYAKWEKTPIRSMLFKDLVPYKPLRDIVKDHVDDVQCLQRLQAKYDREKVPF